MVSRLACEYDGMDLEVGISNCSSDSPYVIIGLVMPQYVFSSGNISSILKYW